MDIRKIKKLIELVEESGISELEITEGEEAVRISRNSPNMMPAMAQYQLPPQAMAAPVYLRPRQRQPLNSAPAADAPAELPSGPHRKIAYGRYVL